MALRDKVKGAAKDIGVEGGVFLGADAISGLANGDSLMKTFLKTLKDVLLWTVSWNVAMKGMFGDMTSGIKAAIVSTGALEAGLRKMGDAAQKAKDDLEDARDALKANAGESWAASEVDRMKDLKRTVEALTPALEEASSTWSVLGNGLEEFKSKATRAAAESGLLGGAIGFLSNGLAVALPIISTLGGLRLAKWFAEWGTAAKAAKVEVAGEWISKFSFGLLGADKATSILAKGARVLSVGLRLMPWAIVATLAISAAGALMGYYNALRHASEAALRMSNASADNIEKLSTQIRHTKTFEDQMRNVGDALDYSTKMYEQWLETISRGKSETEQTAAANALLAANLAVEKAKSTGPGYGSEAIIRQQDAARRQQETGMDIALQNASPEGKVRLLRERARISGEKATAGFAENAAYDKTNADVEKMTADEKQGVSSQYMKWLRGIALRKQILVLQGKDSPAALAASAELQKLEGTNKSYVTASTGDINDEISEMEAHPPRMHADAILLDRKRYEMQMASGSEISRNEGRVAQIVAGGGKEAFPGERAVLEARSDALKKQMQAAPDLKDQQQRSEAEAANAEIELTLARAKQGIEEKIADSQARGFDLVMQQFSATHKMLAAEEDAEFAKARNRGGDVDKDAMQIIRTKIAANNKAREIAVEEHAISKAGLDSESNIAEMKERGSDREEKAAQFQIDAMKKQLAIGLHLSDEEKQNYTNRIKVAEFELARAKERHQLERDGIVARINASKLESEGALEASRGNFSGAAAKEQQAQQIRDAANYRERLAENIEKFGAGKGKTVTDRQEADIRAARERSAEAYRNSKYRELQEGRLGLSYNAADQQKLIGMQDQDKWNAAYQEAKSRLPATASGAKEAAKIAGEQTRQEILSGVGGPVVSSLARIGLGGGVADPTIGIRERIAKNTERTANAVEKMANGDDMEDQPAPRPDAWSSQ